MWKKEEESKKVKEERGWEKLSGKDKGTATPVRYEGIKYKKIKR